MPKKMKPATIGNVGLGSYSITGSPGVPITLNGNAYAITGSLGGKSYSTGMILGSTLHQGVHDIRSHLFKVDIGDYDSILVTSIIRSIDFETDRMIISFLLDDKDTIREAFNEYHYFRLSYLDTKGNPVETYEIKTDPIAETKYILPNVRHDLSDIPNWKLIWSPYNVTKI